MYFTILVHYTNCAHFTVAVHYNRYHHTGPISSVYALREGLARLAEIVSYLSFRFAQVT